MQNNIYSFRLTFGVNSKVLRFKKPTLQKLILVTFKIDLFSKYKSIVERYAESANINLDNNELEIFDEEGIIEKDINTKKIIGICPGAKHYTKRWPKEYFIELSKKLIENGYTIHLFGGIAEKKLCSEIKIAIPEINNFQNQNDLLETARKMKNCSLIITNDSGLMHLASAIKIPVVAIFGSTVKSFGFTPVGVKNIIIENNSLNCRPCSHIGKNHCPKRHFKCMQDITPSLVQDHLQNFMKEI